MRVGTIAMCLLLALGILVSAGCGKKAPPVAPDVKLEGSFDDIRAVSETKTLNPRPPGMNFLEVEPYA